ncbi:MAG: hypothetical protein J5590_00560 [Clostridia bacterium]|nr:hypothetical protein [Clostridia bacterium]
MADNAENMIQNILNDPETMGKISSLISSYKESGGTQTEESSAPFPPENLQMMMKLQGVMSKLSDTDDNGVKLISALKPYLSGKRAESADTAIKLLKISKISSLLENIDL